MKPPARPAPEPFSGEKSPDESTMERLQSGGLLRLGRATGPLTLAALLATALASGCIHTPRAAVSMQVLRHDKTPANASVTIDERYIGPLGYVVARGVRLPLGKHRITVEHDGYFPFDAVVTAKGTTPVRLDVELVPIPD